MIPKNILYTIKLTNDINFSFYFHDPYYNRLINKDFEYEPEIKNILKKIKNLKYLFLDVGANYGYWSLAASSKNIGSKKVIAVEPLKKNFDMCKRNCKLNKSRFALINKALSNSRKKRHLFIDNHSISAVGSTLKKPMNDSLSKVLVDTITIDDLLHKYSKFKYFVIKIDAEGEEINCFKGAKKIFKKKTLIIYEDHASDNKHQTTNYLMKNGYKIFYNFKNKNIVINKVSELNKYKKIKSKGYNFFATRSKDFISRLRND